MSMKTSIIIVDDDPKLRKTLSDILRAKGYAPITVATGQEALDGVEQVTPTVALIDLRLEDMPGLEVMKGFRERSPDTECIVLTGYASQASAIEAISLGAYSYVQKPYDMEQLLVTIRRAVEKRETAETLRESEKRFRTLLEKSVEGIFVLNFEMEFVFWNHAAEEMIGLTTTHTPKITLCDVLTPDSLKVAKSNVAHAAQTGFTRPSPYELTIRKFDGTLVEVEVFIGLVEYQGKPHMLGTARDITERKRAEEALKLSNENFQQVVSNITTVVWKADIGNKGAFENTYTSPVVDELLELPAGTIQNDWDKYFSYIKPEYLEQVNTAFREAIMSPGKKIDCEYEVLKDNGQTAWFYSKGRCFEKNGKLHVFGSTVDITERKRAEQKVKEYLRNIELLSKTAMQFVELPPNIDIYGFVGEKLQEFIGKDSYIVVSSVDEKQDVSTIRAVLGVGRVIDKITKLLGKHPVGMTVNIKGENMYPTPDCKMYSYTEGLYGLLLHAIPKTVCLSIEKLMKIDKIYTVDFTKEDQLLGSVVVFLKEGAEEIKNMEIIETFIKQASIAIQKKQAEEALKFRFVNLAETVSRIFGLRNPYVATHQQGTAKLARAVGEKMGLDEDRLQSLYIGSLLHDIGKTAIPEGILRKPGKLTKAEWGIVRTHPRQGYDVLKDTNLPPLIAELALQHHERLDGSGYPDGLKGDELGLEVRILAVCNVVDAMSLRHPYRLSRSKEEITEEITNGKGTKYDPDVVDVLVDMIGSGKLELAG